MADNLRATAVHGAMWMSLEKWGGQLVKFAAFVVLARLLSPAAFGLITMTLVVLALLEILVDQGLADAVVQRKSVNQVALSTCFWINVVTGAALAIGLALSAPLVVWVFDEPELLSPLRWLTVVPLIVGLSRVHEALLRRSLAFRVLAWRTLLPQSLGAAAGTLYAVVSPSVTALVVQQLVATVASALYLWWRSAWRPSFVFSLGDARAGYRFGLPVMGQGVLGFINGRADELVIGSLFTATHLGLYSTGSRVARLVADGLTGVVTKVGFPVFARLQDDLPRLHRALQRAMLTNATIAFPIFALIGVNAEGLVVTLFGAEWRGGADVLALVAWMRLSASVTNFISPVLNALGRPAVVLWISSLKAILGVFAIIVGARWGITGVAAALLARSALLLPVQLVVMGRYVGIPIAKLAATTRGPSVGTVVLLPVAIWASSATGIAPVDLALSGILGLTVFVVTYRWFGGTLAREEWGRGVRSIAARVARQ